MGQIKRLSSALANQIAAGEVVERPASVVKELVENAIDAGADRIEIIVQQGGRKLIQVTDNGSGMDQADLALAFERHATSKISNAHDLAHIATLGFRGEALPSIASVAQVTARSATGDQEGSEIVVAGGSSQGVKPAPPMKGTSIQVRNLFYNTPARRKFLKRPTTENQHIVEAVRRFALCNPQIAFSLTSDNKDIFTLPPADLKARIGGVFDRFYQKSLKEVFLEKTPFKVQGYVGNLSLVRGRPKEQYIFLNGRAVHDRLLNSAVYAAFRSLISRGEYPFFVLQISLPVDALDVNVHPAKTEVRFKDEWRVYHVVKTAVTEAIKDIPGMMPEFHKPFDSAPGGGFGPAPDPQLANRGADLFESAPRPGQSHRSEDSPTFDAGQAAQRAEVATAPIIPDRPDRPYNPESIWQVHNKYIISQVASGLVMIDQHVAHERVLFEEAQRALTGNPLPSQTVLFPQVLELAPDEFSRLLDLIPQLERLGFRLREFGKNTVVIDGVPIDVIWGREKEIIRDILDREEQGHSGAKVFDQMAASYACHAAIKAGDPLNLEEMRTLVDRLFATQHPYYCPHGRPTVVHLSLAEIDKRFERI
ncbi:MAG: DNA mismatch repair endonuclease MutL [Candidatus Marinimicrobia bacterium]|nr:DNA mismatch repair endonuclease MutL [Candidatus Neomarinimicrobiota bacterium]